MGILTKPIKSVLKKKSLGALTGDSVGSALPFPMNLAGHLSDYWKKIKYYSNGDFTGVDITQRRSMTAEVKKMSAMATAAVAPMPIPFADFWTITPIQIMMVRAIGNIYGYKMDSKTVRALLGTLGGGVIGRQIFLGLMKFGLPVAGGIAGAGFAYVWTMGMAKAAQVYFESGMKADEIVLKEALKEGMEEAKELPVLE